MKLQKNNKYSKKITLGLSAAILSASLLMGCGNDRVEEKIYSKEVYEVTPIPASIPKPMEELSYDEEINLLGIKDTNLTGTIGMLNIVEYSNNGVNRVMLVYTNSYSNENGGYDVYEWFTNEKVFTINYDLSLCEEEEEAIYDVSKISAVNELLKDAKILNCFHIRYLEFNSTFVMEDFMNSKYYNMIAPQTIKEAYEFYSIDMTNLEIADMYLDIVPKEYRVTADELIIENKVLIK